MRFLSKFLVLMFLAGLSLSAQAEEFDDLFRRYHFESQRYNAAQIQAQNSATLRHLARTQKSTRYPSRVQSIDKRIATQIFDGVDSHPVAGTMEVDRYDPDGSIGFCFGRAMTVHLEALYRGISKDSIRKIWIVGDLRTGATQWRYHVTAAIRGPGSTWYAIDPITERVMTVEQWYNEMREYDSNGKMKLYVTEAQKFAPATGKYYSSHMLDPFYNRYFKELLKYYRENGPVSGPSLIRGESAAEAEAAAGGGIRR